ncbi:HEAT repeat domain-containing protein [Natrialba sp. INN-245]|uniref:HEAT repeat domain-containing protein n=1 Tax=Natrialba sp. INN-245 TaxID=2690967 RepID=UPI00135C46B0|nr:HEAT repeat domain-containing protein [Natrialba sp. INN-245]
MEDSKTDIADRAGQLRQLALTDPERVDLDELGMILSSPTQTPKTHGAAIVALMNVARTQDDVAARFVDDIIRLVNRPSLKTKVALGCLRQLAANDPDAVFEHLDEVTSNVSSDDPDIVQAATGCCVELVDTDPAAFTDMVPMLAALLDSKQQTTRINVVYVLSQIASEYPEEVKPVVPQLVNGITSEDKSYQINALSALGSIVSSYPNAAVDATNDIADTISTSESTTVQANAAGVLGDVGDQHPDAIVDHVPVLMTSLESDDEYLAGNAAAAIVTLVTEEPDAVVDSIPALVEHLDHPSPVLRRNVCKALGHLEATIAIPKLSSMADSDPDNGVREIASWAVEQV